MFFIAILVVIILLFLFYFGASPDIWVFSSTFLCNWGGMEQQDMRSERPLGHWVGKASGFCTLIWKL